jgi:hypothetical protein
MANEKMPPHSDASVFEERLTFFSKPAEGEESKKFNLFDDADTHNSCVSNSRTGW